MFFLLTDGHDIIDDAEALNSLNSKRESSLDYLKKLFVLIKSLFKKKDNENINNDWEKKKKTYNE